MVCGNLGATNQLAIFRKRIRSPLAISFNMPLGAFAVLFQKPLAISVAFSGSIGPAKTVVANRSNDDKIVVNLSVFISFR